MGGKQLTTADSGMISVVLPHAGMEPEAQAAVAAPRAAAHDGMEPQVQRYRDIARRYWHWSISR